MCVLSLECAKNKNENSSVTRAMGLIEIVGRMARKPCRAGGIVEWSRGVRGGRKA